MLMNRDPLQNENELLSRCSQIEGLTLSQLARQLQLIIPADPLRRKGWAGQAIELALGGSAGNQSIPDFHHLGIELKTLPINHLGKPSESTYVTNIPLLTIHQEHWVSSQCYGKLKRVLWLPIEANKKLPFEHRRIGKAILWSPSMQQYAILEADWNEHVMMIATGKLAEIDASMGQYLQVRPKGANGKSLCYGYNDTGNKIRTLPRGFYLRATFTASIL
ncbi:MAG: DNA mismatch repair endonuclease MutH [Legionella sp.]